MQASMHIHASKHAYTCKQACKQALLYDFKIGK